MSNSCVILINSFNNVNVTIFCRFFKLWNSWMFNGLVNCRPFCPVGGVLRFPLSGNKISKAWAGPGRSGKNFHLGVTPSTLRTRYNLTAADIGRAANNSQAVAQVLQSNCSLLSFRLL